MAKNVIRLLKSTIAVKRDGTYSQKAAGKEDPIVYPRGEAARARSVALSGGDVTHVIFFYKDGAPSVRTGKGGKVTKRPALINWLINNKKPGGRS